MEDELLCEEVRKYPILYDKSHKGYKEKVVVQNAWSNVVKELPFIENGNTFLALSQNLYIFPALDGMEKDFHPNSCSKLFELNNVIL